MKRASLSATARVKIFKAHDGVCHLCGLKIEAGHAWEVSHDRPLALLGEDDDENRKPAHLKCHRVQTREIDMPAITKAKRQEASHIGARRSKSPLPFGRNSKLKKKISGEIVRR